MSSAANIIARPWIWPYHYFLSSDWLDLAFQIHELNLSPEIMNLHAIDATVHQLWSSKYETVSSLVRINAMWRWPHIPQLRLKFHYNNFFWLEQRNVEFQVLKLLPNFQYPRKVLQNLRLEKRNKNLSSLSKTTTHIYLRVICKLLSDCEFLIE